MKQSSHDELPFAFGLAPCFLLLAVALLAALLRKYTPSMQLAWGKLCDGKEETSTGRKAFAVAAGTPPLAPLGIATVSSTFSLRKDGSVSEPRIPIYKPPKLPHDLGHRRYNSVAAAEEVLAIKLLNLDAETVLRSVTKWHESRGTANVWNAVMQDTAVVARRSTLCALWGLSSGAVVVRVRCLRGLVYLDRAHRVTAPPQRAQRAPRYGRRFEAAATQHFETSTMPASFVAAVKVALNSVPTLLFTEVDGVAHDSWLGAHATAPCPRACDEDSVESATAQLCVGEELGIVELKCRTCRLESQDFSSEARMMWAQCVLGGVASLKLGVRAGGRLVAVQSISMQRLVEVAQIDDPVWTPEAALGILDDRLKFVVQHAVEGADFEVSLKRGETGQIHLQMCDRKSHRVIAISGVM